MEFEQLKQKAHDLPRTPGVYIMKDKTGTIIYIGKAKSLRSRVSQYFANLASHTAKTRQMVSRIDSFETIFADSEFEALLLENTLIKKHKPKYNILLKDDKGYPFVAIGKGEYPRFSIESAVKDRDLEYFGPYGARGSAKAAIEMLQQTFLLPTCARVFPRDIGKDRPCLRYQMKKCCGVCTGKVSPEEYGALIDQCRSLLKGNDKDLEKQLTADMERYAEALEFEKAAACRDRIRNLQKMGLRHTVTGGRLSDRDALAYVTRGSRACISLLSFVQGNLIDKKVTFFDGLEENDMPDAVESYIKQYYGIFQSAPREICLAAPLEDTAPLEEYLSGLRGSRVEITCPQRGERLRQARLAESNARLELETLETREQKSKKLLELLRDALSMDRLPERIEAFDISNTAGDLPVASMTVFVGGKASKKDYKKYKIKTAAGGDDYGAMAEVLGRRLDRALAGDAGFLPLPDLFLIDGGQGQTQMAAGQLQTRGLEIPVCGMVKDDHHRTRALVGADGHEIGLRATPPLFAFIGRIQEETHRFAIEYHREQRSKEMRRSQLDGIAGLGPQRRKKLLERFGTIRAIRAADMEELAAVVPRGVAENIKRKFGEEDADHQRTPAGQAADAAPGHDDPADHR